MNVCTVLRLFRQKVTLSLRCESGLCLVCLLLFCLLLFRLLQFRLLSFRLLNIFTSIWSSKSYPTLSVASQLARWQSYFSELKLVTDNLLSIHTLLKFNLQFNVL